MADSDTTPDTDPAVNTLPGISQISPSFIVLDAGKGLYIAAGQSSPGTENAPDQITATTGNPPANEGNFYISGQNGGAVINSGNGGGGNTGNPNGSGIGSIYITSANGDVVINCSNGNMESNVGANTTNNNQGNVTNNTQGNQTNYTHGNQSSYTWGNQYAWGQGNQTSIVEDTSNTIIMGGLDQVVVGNSNQDYLGNNFNFTLGAMENTTIGLDLETFIGGQFTLNLAYQNEYAPFESKETEASIETIQAKIAAHEALIANIASNILTAEANLNTAGIHIFT
jgi:hypothetical protein